MASEATDFYKNCNLNGNPFQTNPVQEMDPRMGIWVGYNKEKIVFRKFLERTRADQVGNTNLLMIYGDLGTGKSHSLLWARHMILNKERDTYNSVAYYVQTLKKDKGKMSFAGAFRYDIVGKSDLIADTRDFKEFLDDSVVKYKDANGLGHETRREEVVEKLIPSIEFYNFAKQIIHCESESDVENLLLPSGLTDYEAMQIFSRLMNLFVYDIQIEGRARRFKNASYLFLDELDLLAEVAAKEARETNELFRHLYDLIPRCFCMVLGFTATAAELNIIFDDTAVPLTFTPIPTDELRSVYREEGRFVIKQTGLVFQRD